MPRNHTSHVEAECAGCEWEDRRPGAHGRAAQHHDRTGHTVSVRQTIVYARLEAPDAPATMGMFDPPPQEDP